MRVLCSGKTLAFQANDASSILATRSKKTHVTLQHFKIQILNLKFQLWVDKKIFLISIRNNMFFTLVSIPNDLRNLYQCDRIVMCLKTKYTSQALTFYYPPLCI